MSTQLSKLQPNRTIALRGFDSLGGSAALHNATENSFTVSGTFRDSADFAVLLLWDADNFYEHPRLRYLPDFNFSGATLEFDVLYTPGLQPLDSPKSNWIDWATLDYIPTDGPPGKLRIWDNCRLKSGNFTPASGTFHLQSTADGIQASDRLTLFYQNFSFDYVPAPGVASVEYQFFAAGNGTPHNITVNGRSYTHTEAALLGESSAAQADALVSLINTGTGDPDVIATIGSVPYSVLITLRANAAVAVSATGYGISALGPASLSQVAPALAQQINNTDWWTAYPTHALRATAAGNTLTVTAARYGKVSTGAATASTTTVTLTWGCVFAGLLPGATLTIAGILYTVASVESPTSLTLTTSAGTQTNVGYVADRGGADGNMIELYALSASPSLTTAEPFLRLSGGNSAVTWTCTIDFSAHNLNSLRQCWFTYAAALANSAAFSDTEWSATYTNWTFTGPDAATRLSVAGPGSVRVEENSTACTYTGTWTTPSPESGFFSQGLARRAGSPSTVTNETLTVRYRCSSRHNLMIGTSLYLNSANLWISLDGAPEFAFSLYLDTGSGPAVNTRRVMVLSVAPGDHTVHFRLKDPGYFYFDFLEAAVLSDVPGAPTPRPNISPALDYSTDHSWKLPPARIFWILDNLGLTGPINQYIGVFWWNQRTNPTAVFRTAQVTFSRPANGTILTLTLGGTPIQKTVFPADTTATIASHFARYINATFVGVWASALSSTLTITKRSPAYEFTFDAGPLPITGSLSKFAADYGTWLVDPTQSLALNRGARDWHADLYREAKLRNREITTAGSMELVNPPPGFAACYPNGSPVITDVGFGNMKSTHCAQSSLMRLFQQSVFDCVADLQNAAGLTPNFQLGEYLWWFFSGPEGMAYYDAETKSAAQTALGRPLYTFLTPTDDPSVNASADALFLRARLRDHVAAVITHVRSRYPNAISEVLFAYDVNYPTINRDHLGDLGGQLNRFINFPAEWGSHTTAGFSRLKVEALAFGSRFRNLNLVREAIEFPLSQDWPLEKIRYLAPVFTHSSTWRKEVAIALGLRIPVVNLWAFDQINIFGLKIAVFHDQSRSTRMG